LVTAARRCAAVEIAVVDARVQGAGAAAEVARAIDWLSRSHERLGIDAVLVTRGGGSMEDLWAFNERVGAEAVLRCAVPVVGAGAGGWRCCGRSGGAGWRRRSCGARCRWSRRSGTRRM